MRRRRPSDSESIERISYSASDKSGQTLTIDAGYVNERLDALAVNEDLSRYVL